MCGRFEVNIPKEKLIQKFGINNWQLDNYQPRYNIPPGTNIPIIRQIGDIRIVDEAYWGLIPLWSKDKKTDVSCLFKSSKAHGIRLRN